MSTKTILRFFIILLISISIGLFVVYMTYENVQNLIDHFWYITVYSIIIGPLLTYGNFAIVGKIQKNDKLQKNPARLFILSSIATFLYSVFVIYLVEVAWQVIYEGVSIADYKFPPFRYVFVIMAITILACFIAFIKDFIIDKQKALLQEERLKTEIIKLEYETLKNQINPHFLFNSLNALASMVTPNPNAVTFINNLADVYRYVLEHKDKETIELHQELNCVSAYLYLHQIRFGKNLTFNICSAPANKMVVPLAVQMLVENALKHNEISADSPLKVSVYIDGDKLIIENNLQLKPVVNSSSKIGLVNIKSRYEYLTDIKIVAGIEGDKFIVKLPLLDRKNS
jgi:two-component system LytT family sensor kinase